MLNSLFWMIIVFLIATIIVAVVNGPELEPSQVNLLYYSIILTILTAIMYFVSLLIKH